jgi:hypothetical protein
MSPIERLQKKYEDLFDRIVYPLPIVPGIPRESLCSFQRLAVGVDEFEGDVEG